MTASSPSPARTWNQNAFDVQGTINLATAALRHDVVLRGDLKWVFSPRNKSSFGVQYAWRQLGLTGTVADARGVAPWAREPIVDSHRPALAIAPSLTRNLLSAYAEHTFLPHQRLAFEGGVRAQYDLSNAVFSGSARLAGALTLPTLTVLKLSGGYVLQPLQTPLALDPTFGNPQAPARAQRAVDRRGGAAAALRGAPAGGRLGQVALEPGGEPRHRAGRAGAGSGRPPCTPTAAPASRTASTPCSSGAPGSSRIIDLVT